MDSGSTPELSTDTTRSLKSGEASTKALQTQEQYLPTVNILYKEFIGKTYIEKYKLEDFVVESIVRGKTISEVAKELNEKLPGTLSVQTWRNDVEKFMERSDELLAFFERDRTALAKRHLDAKAKVEEELAGLILFTKKLVIDANNKGEIANSVSAINALVKVYQQYNNLVGYTTKEPTDSGPKVQTNVLINLSDEKFESLKSKANKADFKIVDVTIPKEEDK